MAGLFFVTNDLRISGDLLSLPTNIGKFTFVMFLAAVAATFVAAMSGTCAGRSRCFR